MGSRCLRFGSRSEAPPQTSAYERTNNEKRTRVSFPHLLTFPVLNCTIYLQIITFIPIITIVLKNGISPQVLKNRERNERGQDFPKEISTTFRRVGTHFISTKTAGPSVSMYGPTVPTAIPFGVWAGHEKTINFFRNVVPAYKYWLYPGWKSPLRR